MIFHERFFQSNKLAMRLEKSLHIWKDLLRKRKLLTKPEEKKKVHQNINFIPGSSAIFIHIPKNSGTSISESLGLAHSFHSTGKEIRENLGKKKYEEFFKFSVIRDPVSRFISLYNYAKMEESYYHSAKNPEKALFGKHEDYDLLKNASLEDCAFHLLKGDLKHDKNWNHWDPQVKWIYDENGVILVDLLLKFENLEEDFEILRSLLNIQKQLNYKNKSDYTKVEVTKRVKEIVREFYSADYKLLKY